MRSDLWMGAALLAALAAGSACDSGGSTKKTDCKDGAMQACDCDGGGEGTQTCQDGKFGACECGVGAALGGLKGRVFDADTGRAVASAELKAKSGASTKSDATGNFELQSEKDLEEVIVSAKSYAPTSKRPPEKGGYMELFIKDVDKEVEFDAQKGAKVKLDSGSSVEIPPGSVIDAESKKVTGMVKMSIAEVAGAERKQASSLPGDLKAKEGNAQGRVAPEGAMEIKIVDKDGKPLNISAESKATADFAVKDADGANERQGFTYNDKDRQWEVDTSAEGKVKKTVNDEGKVVYRKNIDHLSWHAYGDFFSTVTCLRVCVRDGDGAPQVGAQVWMIGASSPGVNSLSTGADGCAAGDLPTQQEVVLVAQTSKGISGAQRYKSGTDIQSAADDPSKCDDGPAPLVIGNAAQTSCPSGFEECGGACVDFGTDPKHCGGCDKPCGGAVGREQSCIAGSCGCPEGTTDCKGSCTNLLTDPKNCGACDKDITAPVDAQLPQECVQGKSVDFNCLYPQAVCDGVCVDTSSNERYCGFSACGPPCEAGQVCLSGSCRSLTDPNLCTVNEGMYPCQSDTSFCNGTEVCDPTSNSADYSGCVRSGPPCTDGATCDEAADMCIPPPACVPTKWNKVETPKSCAAETRTCLSLIPPDLAFQQALNCGGSDKNPPLPATKDELGQPYDCESCIRNDLMVCGENYGCGSQVDALDCCAQRFQCNNSGCIVELCNKEFMALDSCFKAQPADARCLEFIKNTTCLP